MKKTTIQLDSELVSDIENRILDQLTAGKECGGLRKSDSHAMRVRYLYNYWVQSFVYHGSERVVVEREAQKLEFENLKKQIRKDLIKEMKKKLDK